MVIFANSEPKDKQMKVYNVPQEIPLIIQYNRNNLNSIQEKDPKLVLDNLSGVHKCLFIYYDSSTKGGKKRVRIRLKGQNYGIIAEINDKDHLYLRNPWFRKERMMESFYEADSITCVCNLIFINSHEAPLQYLIDHQLSAKLREIQDLIFNCAKLTKPIMPAHTEAEKEIWAAYCDGLNALNRERTDFISINKVEKPFLYNDFKQGEIYTLKLGLVSDSVDDIKRKLSKLIDDKYTIGSIDINDNSSIIDIQFKGIEKINDEDYDHICDYLNKFGFTIVPGGIRNILKVSITLDDLSKNLDLYDQLDSLLLSKGIRFLNNEKLEYTLEDDSDVEVFRECVSTVFGETCHGALHDKFTVPINADDQTIESLRVAFENDKRIVVKQNLIVFEANNKTDFEEMSELLVEEFIKYGINAEIPHYHPVCVVKSAQIARIRQEKMALAEEMLSPIRKKALSYEYNSETSWVIRMEFGFKSAQERENITDELQTIVNELGYPFKLVNKRPLGLTRMSFARDEVLSKKTDEELNYEYFGEEIKLVDGKIYTELFKDVKDPDNIIDPLLRERYNRFISECPIIGTCHKRAKDYIIVNLSDDFFNGERFETPIRINDMVFFPSVGTSTELHRQYEAIQRINKPGVKLPNGRTIQPPVNRNLCDFLFNPLYARNIKDNIQNTIDIIKKRKLEEHLNDKQIEAVAKALLADDISLIQGPPGTGKTTVIAEIIWQEITNNPKCKILLTSQTNLAVDNALERLKYKRVIRPLRVISDLRSNSDDVIYNVNILDEWVNRPNNENKDNVVNSWIDNIIERIEANKTDSDTTKEWHDYLSSKSEEVRRSFVDKYKSEVNLIAATCSICGSQQFFQTFQKMYDTEDVEFDVVIMDEASKATPLEMAIPMVLGKKIIIIGDHKQLPPLLDENSLDTALQKIGRNDLAARIQELKESQFKKLFQMAQKFVPNLVTTLNIQYRMHNDIMQTINHFYFDELGENGLVCGIQDVQDVPDYKVKGSRWHGILLEPFINPQTHAIWVNVEGRETKERTSFKNMEEVKAVQTVLTALSKAKGFDDYIKAQKRIEDKEIGLITFYSAQRRELKKLEQDRAIDTSYDYRIDVVDRFQGMERNIVIVSTVRSNSYNGIGFAKEIERINVAFSRARSLLIVIGNRNLFYTKYNYKKSIDSMETIDIKQLEDLLKYE